MILWEDTIQQELSARKMYTGVSVLPQVQRAQVSSTIEEDEAHIAYATRRSHYFAHTKTGKRQAERPIVRVKVDPWGLR